MPIAMLTTPSSGHTCCPATSSALDDELDGANQQIAASSRALERVNEARKRAISISSGYGDLIAATAPASEPLELRDDEISERIDELETVLKQARDAAQPARQRSRLGGARGAQLRDRASLRGAEEPARPQARRGRA